MSNLEGKSNFIPNSPVKAGGGKLMHNLSWMVIFFYSIPECFLILSLGLQLINYRPPFLPLLYISLIYGPFCYVIRRVDIPFGLHTILQTIVIICLLFVFLRVPLVKGAIAVLIGVVIIISLELISSPLLSSITNISYADIIKTPLYTILFPLPDLLIITVICWILRRKNLYLFNLNN